MNRELNASDRDPLETFEDALRRENEQVHPSVELTERISKRLDEKEPTSDQYRLVVAASRFRLRTRRMVYAMAAIIAIGVTTSLIVLQRASHHAPANVVINEPATDELTKTAIPQSERRTAVSFTGDNPVIVRELPTERTDVTIVWIYEAARPSPPAEPLPEPVGAIPTPETHATGTHS